MESILAIIILAIGLSMDSFSVSLSNGLSIRNLPFRKSLIIASILAFFHALMPFLGWLSGIGFKDYIEEIDHWIAFVLLSFIGGKMLYEGLTQKFNDTIKDLKISILIVQAIATSIDAFTVGLSFAFFEVNILSSILIISGTTFVFSLLGLFLGKKLGKKIGNKAEIFGGLVLIGIGVKILIEHLFFG